MEIGAITGSAWDIQEAQTQTRVWASASLGVRLEVRIGGSVFVVLAPQVDAPLTRHRFVLPQLYVRKRRLPVKRVLWRMVVQFIELSMPGAA